MHFPTRIFVTAALFGILAGRAAATPFTQINTALAVTNDYSSFIRTDPTTWNGTTQLLSWGLLNDNNNSVRDFQYTGTTRFALTSITFTGRANYGAPDAQFATAQQDLSVQLVTNGVTGQPQQFVNLSNKATPPPASTFPPAGTGIAIGKSFNYEGLGGSNVIASNSTFSFQFYEASRNSSSGPDAYYDAPFTVTFNGTVLVPTLNVDPTTLNFTGRAGTGPVATQPTAISNTGAAGSLLVGNAGAPASGGPFSGGNVAFSLEKTDASHPALPVNYGFTPLASANGSTTGRLSQDTVQITSVDGGNQPLTLNGTTVSPVFQMADRSGTPVANGATIVDFGQVRQGTSVSTAASVTGPKVTNTFTQDLAALTTLTVASTTSGNGFSFAPGFSGSTVAGGNNSIKADVVFNTSGISTGARTQVLGIGTDQDAALGNTGAGTQFGYEVKGTVVGPDGTATDIKSVFDFTGSNVVIQPNDVRTGVVDLGNNMPWTVADLLIHNILPTCDAVDPTKNDQLCGITIGTIAWADQPTTPLAGLDILDPLTLSTLFEVTGITYPSGKVLSAGSIDELRIQVRFNGNASLLPGIYDRTLIINTDVGTDFGNTTGGRQYRFQFTASVGQTPEPATLLLLGSTLGLLLAARSRRNSGQRSDSLSGP